MSNTHEPTKGYGRIYVDMHNAPEGIKIPVSGRIAWDMLEIRELVDVFQAHIDLLPEYTITGVFFDVSRRAWCLLVESETIPLPEFGEMIHDCCGGFRRAYFGDPAPSVRHTATGRHTHLALDYTMSLQVDMLLT